MNLFRLILVSKSNLTENGLFIYKMSVFFDLQNYLYCTNFNPSWWHFSDALLPDSAIQSQLLLQQFFFYKSWPKIPRFAVVLCFGAIHDFIEKYLSNKVILSSKYNFKNLPAIIWNLRSIFTKLLLTFYSRLLTFHSFLVLKQYNLFYILTMIGNSCKRSCN